MSNKNGFICDTMKNNRPQTGMTNSMENIPSGGDTFSAGQEITKLEGTWWFITVNTTGPYPKPIKTQSKQSHPMYNYFNIILLHPNFPKSSFTFNFPTRTVCIFLMSCMYTLCPIHPSWYDHSKWWGEQRLTTQNTYVQVYL
jgi:hypothetical protein